MLKLCVINWNLNRFVYIFWNLWDSNIWNNFILNIINFVIPFYTKGIIELNLTYYIALSVYDLTIRPFCTCNKNLIVDFLRTYQKRIYFHLTSLCKSLESSLCLFRNNNLIILYFNLAFFKKKYFTLK